MTVHVGIDLGTQTLVGAPAPTADAAANQKPQWTGVPCVFGHASDGTQLMGDRARRLALLRPERFVATAVRMLGRRFDELPEAQTGQWTRGPNGDLRVVLDGVPRTLEWVVGELLRGLREQLCGPSSTGSQIAFPGSLAELNELVGRLREDAEHGVPFSHTDSTGPQAVVAVPIAAGPSTRQSVREACVQAGIVPTRLIHSTSAVALAYCVARDAELSARTDPKLVAIHDFGAGNFSVAIVEVTQDGVRELATGGLGNVGGNDLDQRVCEWMLERFEDDSEVDASDDPVVRSRMTHAAGNAKVLLGSEDPQPEVPLHLPFLQADVTGSRHYRDTLTLQRFDELVADLVARCLETTRQTLARAEKSPGEIEAVLLTGGGARVGLLQERIESLYQQEPNLGYSAPEVVANGAALLASPGNELQLQEVAAFPIVIRLGDAEPQLVVARGVDLPATRGFSVEIGPDIVDQANDESRWIEPEVATGSRDEEVTETVADQGLPASDEDSDTGADADGLPAPAAQKPAASTGQSQVPPDYKVTIVAPDARGRGSRQDQAKPEKSESSSVSEATPEATPKSRSVVIRRRRKSTQAHHRVRREQGEMPEEISDVSTQSSDAMGNPEPEGSTDTAEQASDEAGADRPNEAGSEVQPASAGDEAVDEERSLESVADTEAEESEALAAAEVASLTTEGPEAAAEEVVGVVTGQTGEEITERPGPTTEEFPGEDQEPRSEAKGPEVAEGEPDVGVVDETRESVSAGEEHNGALGDVDQTEDEKQAEVEGRVEAEVGEVEPLRVAQQVEFEGVAEEKQAEAGEAAEGDGATEEVAEGEGVAEVEEVAEVGEAVEGGDGATEEQAAEDEVAEVAEVEEVAEVGAAVEGGDGATEEQAAEDEEVAEAEEVAGVGEAFEDGDGASEEQAAEAEEVAEAGEVAGVGEAFEDGDGATEEQASEAEEVAEAGESVEGGDATEEQAAEDEASEVAEVVEAEEAAEEQAVEAEGAVEGGDGAAEEQAVEGGDGAAEEQAVEAEEAVEGGDRAAEEQAVEGGDGAAEEQAVEAEEAVEGGDGAAEKQAATQMADQYAPADTASEKQPLDEAGEVAERETDPEQDAATINSVQRRPRPELLVYGSEPGPTGTCEHLIGRVELERAWLQKASTLAVSIELGNDQTLGVVRVNGKSVALRDTAAVDPAEREDAAATAALAAETRDRKRQILARRHYLENWVGRAHQVLSAPSTSDEEREARETLADALRSAEGCLRSQRQSLIDGALEELLGIMRQMPRGLIEQLAPSGPPAAEQPTTPAVTPEAEASTSENQAQESPEPKAPRKRGSKRRRRRSG